ncbi:ComEA family DNA-binding protein [Micromonospora matsumotoense]
MRRRLYRLTDGVSAASPPAGPSPSPRPHGPVGLRVPAGDDVGGVTTRRRSGLAADTGPRDAGAAGASPDVGPFDADWARHTEVDDPVRGGGPARSADLDRAYPAAGDDGIPAGRLPGPGVFDPGRRGVRALAAVAVVVVLGAGFWAWRSRPQAQPVPTVTAVAGPEASAGSASGPAPKPTGELVVAVAGKVRRPGLVRVPAGARVADAVEAAGGALPGTDVALLNPARKVADGELILVGVTAPPGGAGPDGAAAGPSAAAGGGVPGARVNLNTATLAQLDALPGVGPVLAQRILTHRDQQGGFRSVGDLRQVDGIGDARYEQLKDLVTV